LKELAALISVSMEFRREVVWDESPDLVYLRRLTGAEERPARMAMTALKFLKVLRRCERRGGDEVEE